jgi:hypothetical protein
LTAFIKFLDQGFVANINFSEITPYDCPEADVANQKKSQDIARPTSCYCSAVFLNASIDLRNESNLTIFSGDWL